MSGYDHMYARSARFLRQAGDQLFDFLTDDHHHIREFVDNDHDLRQWLEHPSRRFRVVRIWRIERIRNRLTFFG